MLPLQVTCKETARPHKRMLIPLLLLIVDANPPTHTVFSQDQLAALKYQILAYKLISKNMPLPITLQQAVLAPVAPAPVNTPQQSPHPDNQLTPTTPLSIGQQDTAAPPAPSSNVPPDTTTNTILDTATVTSIPPVVSKPMPATTTPTTMTSSPPLTQQQQQQQQPVEAIAYNAYASPYNLMKKPISSFAHASRQQRLLIPSITPSGLDTQALIHAREKQIQGRMAYRQSQLELDSNPSSSTEDRIATATELRGLKLLEKQRKVNLVVIYSLFT